MFSWVEEEGECVGGGHCLYHSGLERTGHRGSRIINIHSMAIYLPVYTLTLIYTGIGFSAKNQAEHHNCISLGTMIDFNDYIG
jgi:hypothetical protein